MARKPITWIGSLVILAAGGFCWWALAKYRTAYGIVDTRYTLLTVGIFVAPVVAVIATSLWYYFNEKTEEVKPSTEPNQVINTKVNKQFPIALSSNVTTDYSWQVAYDTKVLNLVEKTYKAQDNTGKQIVGTSGTEYFNFKAISRGKTKVTFTYRRPGEQSTAQDNTLVFTVSIQ